MQVSCVGGIRGILTCKFQRVWSFASNKDVGGREFECAEAYYTPIYGLKVSYRLPVPKLTLHSSHSHLHLLLVSLIISVVPFDPYPQPGILPSHALLHQIKFKPHICTSSGSQGKSECYGVFCLTYDLQAEEETKSWKKLISIAVSGAAGMISNHLLFKIASGEVFGPNQPVALKLLGSERSIQALEGVAMELEDSLFPLLREVSIGINPYEVFQDAEWALLIGAKPRGPGMERADLLDINGQIFAEQGKALNASASPNVKVIVVGNPCNTNALICMKNAPNIPAKNFHALTRLDENRAKCQLALKAGVFYDQVSNMTIWGNHSTTQVPDFLNARIKGLPVKEVIKDHKWLEEEFTEKVQKRGGVLIKKWGRSSAASTAVSIVDAIRSLITPTPEGDWFSSGVYTNGNPYGIVEDIVFSMPCRSKGDGDYELVKDSEAELLAEKRCVAHLTGEGIGFCDLPEDTMLPGEM
ncbi:hypothetical protein CXB51_004593 [Gossypium anomalum]|uniref:Malate dehydrogenase [NADP], chloroplastic n=1 Tax=Gossypium anomalum TaxID=47600 RepID=A0A8J6DAQ0_9ROSI|nr:hypothetical protein CXB51_004593 [Gossypium anomalum]